MIDYTKLEKTITSLESGVPSAIALLNTLFAEFKASKDDPAKVDALADRGLAMADRLAAAVVADSTTPPVVTPEV